jgi:outer membrane biosynthesis protein TonB
MPLPRPLLLALLGAVLAAGAFIATRNSSDTVDPPPESSSVEPAPGADTPPPGNTTLKAEANGPQKAEAKKAEPNNPQSQKAEPTKAEPKNSERGNAEPKSKPETQNSSQPDQAKKPKPDQRQREKAKAKPRSPGTSPAAVRRAVAQGRVVILFFRQRGADDDAVAGALSAVRGSRGVAVFTLPVGKAPKYAEVGGANVVQAPTLVLLHRKQDPRMFEGYIDAATLRQAVTDAR